MTSLAERGIYDHILFDQELRKVAARVRLSGFKAHSQLRAQFLWFPCLLNSVIVVRP